MNGEVRKALSTFGARTGTLQEGVSSIELLTAR